MAVGYTPPLVFRFHLILLQTQFEPMLIQIPFTSSIGIRQKTSTIEKSPTNPSRFFECQHPYFGRRGQKTQATDVIDVHIFGRINQ